MPGMCPVSAVYPAKLSMCPGRRCDIRLEITGKLLSKRLFKVTENQGLRRYPD